jgi:predicted ATPase/transcriptional regulator with XRE-family HTH domain
LSRQRKAQDLTQEELAERIGCSTVAIQKIELGERRPSKQLAELLAGYFHVPTEEWAEFLQFARGRTDERTHLHFTTRAIGTVDNRQSTIERPDNPNNLPLQLTSFVGRDAELPRLHDLMLTAEARLVTLTGPPGTGKTRLALQAAARLLKDFEDGVFFVNLAPITDPALVISQIAQTQGKGIGEGSDRSLLEGIEAYFRDKRLLLVLDNFEQVVEAAPMVGQLLMAAPTLKVIATSRVPLHIRGEKEFAVPPLHLPDLQHLPSVAADVSWYEAVRLFIERAKDVSAGFELTDDNARAVAQICASLDGLPLAIELAAARVKVLSPEAILSRLESRLRFLTGGPRDLPSRQRTLRSAIEWSYDLLDQEEKKLFRRLAVFVGGFSLEAAEAVCGRGAGDPQSTTRSPGSGPETRIQDRQALLDGIASLVDKSLLRQHEGMGGEPRFAMLETIHEYARERLEESGESEEMKRLHGLYFLEFAEQADLHLPDADQTVWFDRLDSELGNLRTAFRWTQSEGGDPELGLRMAAALGRFWSIRGYAQEGREGLSRMLSITNARSRTSTRGKALMWAGWLAFFQSDYVTARNFLEESLGILRERGEKQDVAAVLDILGEIAHYQGDYVRAIKYLDECLSINRELNDVAGIALALLFLGYSELRLVEMQDATVPLARLEEALALSRQVGVGYFMAQSLRMVGEIELRQGNYDRATSLVEESLSISRELGNKWGVAACLGTLGWQALLQGNNERATQLLRESLSTRHGIGDRGGIAWCLEWFARVAIAETETEVETQHAVRAALLLGAADGIRKVAGSVIDPADLGEYERNVNRLQVQLPGEAFERAWQEGRAMSIEQAIEYALKVQVLGDSP